ncbi:MULTISPECIES: hypothetical protein [unclassified Leifsonia]|uniref:hypothetical protein n=1 Tax=unclassified Leifsonia TaxID=2663824 RepID=UPI0008A7DB25|nr:MULTISPECIES: hypothetical protein [unclassified Leifsonia]SEI08514.1 hypothetical protein SAMN04515694_1142 [Leifsonia sp. CL154]SFL82926.1 hypothetical protein SAMN04515692_1142 [Leifsonia sp. CL147]
MTLDDGATSEAMVVEAVRAARAQTRDADVIDGVKKAVADELIRLDPNLKIKKTEYFNHSYIPDMVATWRESGKPQERRVFIRGSLSTMVASEDVEALSDQNPLLISLGDESRRIVKQLRAQMPKATRTLATEVSATARISSGERGTDREAQLSGLVRANIVRGGRGVLTDADADRIVAVEHQKPVEALKAFQQTVQKLFVGSTAERLTRTAGLLSTFFEERPSGAVLGALREEPLSDGELRVVLPYVLHRAADVRSPDVWATLGGMLTLERIESLAPALSDVDVTPLIRPVVGALTAGRSALFFNADETSDEQKDAETPRWKVQNGKLAANVHRWSLWMGSDGRKIRGRDDGADARWDELSSPLRSFDLAAIELHGLSRQLGVSNPKPGAVREDVELFRRTIDDDFHVASVTVREEDQPETPEVKVEFAASTATGKAPVSFHVRVASLLAVKRPFSDADVDELIGK